MKMKNLKLYLISIGAIIKRDMKIFFRYPINAIFSILEPVIWIAPVYFLAKSFQIGGKNIGFEQYAGTNDYMAYIVIGSIIGSFISSVMWGMGFSLKEEMDTGVIESNWLTPIPIWIQLIGRSLFSLVITTINSVTTAFLIWILFGFNIGRGILSSIITLIPFLIALYGLASLVLITNNANNIIDISNYLLTTLSGQNFPITVLPKYLMAISFALPLTYGFDAIRGILLDTHTILPLNTERLILLIFMCFGITVGIQILNKVINYCKKIGNIGFH
jgi:ABC-2 type transport system permease protein